MEILKVKSSINGNTYYTTKEAYDSIVVNGLKKQQGEKLGVVLGLEIVRELKKSVRFEKNTSKRIKEQATDLCNMSNKKREKDFYGYVVPACTLTKEDMYTTKEMSRVCKGLDAEVSRGSKWTGDNGVNNILRGLSNAM